MTEETIGRSLVAEIDATAEKMGGYAKVLKVKGGQVFYELMLANVRVRYHFPLPGELRRIFPRPKVM